MVAGLRIGSGLLLACVVASMPVAAAAQDAQVDRGISFLKQSAPGADIGEAALGGLAMVKAGMPADDPAVSAIVERVLERFDTGGRYEPARSGGSDIYEAGVVAMLLANLGGPSYRPQLQQVASYLRGKQKGNGAWDYANRQGDTGDCSISQYALLGLWELENAGVKMPPTVWERAARWYISVQEPSGGWSYHPDAGRNPTVSMTAAGVGSILICRRQLEPYEKRREKPISPLLTPLVPEDEYADYRVGISEARFERSIEAGLRFIVGNFRPGDAVFGPSSYYGLYGVERVGSLSDRERIGALDWFDVGGRYIASTQGGNGGWSGQYGTVPNTAWALLFLTRATKKSLARVEVERLGSGTLLGGRGLPEDLSSLTVARGRVVVRPMNGAVEEMLAVLEDARAEDAETALAGLIERYFTGGPLALRPYTDRFRALLEDGTVTQRQTAAWALARTGDLAAAPDLIEALEDPNEEVVATARYGLRLLSRKLDGFGPPTGADAEQKKQAARRWREWYESVRPPELEGQLPGASLD